jgi:hypothetical protein
MSNWHLGMQPDESFLPRSSLPRPCLSHWYRMDLLGTIMPLAQSEEPPVRRRRLALSAYKAPLPWTQQPRPYVFRSVLMSAPEAQEGGLMKKGLESFFGEGWVCFVRDEAGLCREPL